MHLYALCTSLWNLALIALTMSAQLASAAPSWTTEPFSPPAYPLAVRSPYLSCWLPQGNGTALNADWPRFWEGSILGWAGYIRVDGAVYTFLGSPSVSGPTLAVQKSAMFTSTQSVFILTAGGVDLIAAFLSPVEPDDMVKQSTPFSYLSLIAQSNDGASHSVQLYTDISAEWVSGDNSLIANWTTSIGDIVTHQVQLQDQTHYSEASDHIQHGAAYYSTKAATGLTYQTGSDQNLRTQFVQNGVLLNTQDTDYRAVNDDWPVFALARDMGNVTSATEPFVMSIGHAREPAVQYIVSGGVLQDRSLYFWSAYATIADAISFFLNDYASALSRATAFDSKVATDAAEVSSSYGGIVALSIRQAFAAMEITISKTSTGWNTDDVLVFLKEISSNGNTNTVDVIFPAWPLYLYTNPTIGKNLLLPALQYQVTGQYPNKWSIHDMGAHYPRAIGHNDGQDEAMPLEECGNMLIMTLSHYQHTGDLYIINSYAQLLDQWTQYLIEEALIPANQISTDDFAGPLVNQTNLAIKGIIGIRAMAEIACLLGQHEKSANYTSIAQSYVAQWQSLATSFDGRHLTLSYGNNTSWGLTYNLYAEKLLGFNLFPQSVYDMQTAWYQTVIQEWGFPLDTRHTYTKTDWSIWTAATVSSTNVRDQFIGAIYNYASNGKNKAPFSDWYETTTGEVTGFRARPVVGGHLALMKGVLPTASAKSAKFKRAENGTCGILQSSGVGTSLPTANNTRNSGSKRREVMMTGWIAGVAGMVIGLLR
ncbi:hypothetical protein M408DRAFT_119277 [Serendipita vermifera MAFF 305830]|uniref:DUF1793-domain-containing protein n=1 Tax=Serendipita vermifera MAFF 305830 TaxID=933852 RepID=A0A0C3A881_SERVB|nr:hypothetical protein M408DRAFT_119277 [Serendipita vermifera MAFF 305830]